MIFTIDAVTAVLLVMILISTVYYLPNTNKINSFYGEDIINIYLQTKSITPINTISRISHICGSMYIDGETVMYSNCNCGNVIVVKKMYYEDGWHEIEFKYCQ
ncbi:hypothetical protein J7J26_00075 [Candidatus Micrarchaeota archaeon]|nr:hypothetical protein [Candidatus Micrarchaeota archaeon]